MPQGPGNLSGTQKTNISSIDSAISTALGNLKDPNDSSQKAAIVVLRQMRRQLELLKQERNF